MNRVQSTESGIRKEQFTATALPIVWVGAITTEAVTVDGRELVEAWRCDHSHKSHGDAQICANDHVRENITGAIYSKMKG